MIEMCSKFPKPEMLERLAKALDIETHELFTVYPSTKNELENLRQDIKGELEQLIVNTIKHTLSKELISKKK